MIRYQNLTNGNRIAEIVSDSEMINTPEDMLDIIADAGYNGCIGLIIYEKNLSREFFDLKTGLAGEILQKFSNYRMQLAIVGDFLNIKSKSLRDFIRESNKTGRICFVESLDEAIQFLDTAG